MSKIQKKQELKADKRFGRINFIILLIAFIVVFYPLLYIVSCSFSSAKSVISNKVWLFPKDIDLTAYKAVFSNKSLLLGYRNSLLYLAFGTFLSVMLTMMLAFPLSRKEFYGRKVITGFVIFTMLFKGGTIPLYLIVRKVGIYNTVWAMILPNAIFVYDVIIARTFLKSSIPDDLYNAAQIDGCSDSRFFFQMVLPLSGAILAVLALFYAVSIWNKYFDALLYLQNQKLFPLQLILRNILIVNNQVDPGMLSDASAAARLQGLSVTIRYAIIVVASAPLLIIYPFVQKFFVTGVMIGSVKE